MLCLAGTPVRVPQYVHPDGTFDPVAVVGRGDERVGLGSACYESGPGAPGRRRKYRTPGAKRRRARRRAVVPIDLS